MAKCNQLTLLPFKGSNRTLSIYLSVCLFFTCTHDFIQYARLWQKHFLDCCDGKQQKQCLLIDNSCSSWYMYRVVQKIGTPFLYALTLPDILTDFQNYFNVRIRRKLIVILSPNIPPHLKCVATLPCEMSAFHWSRHWSVASPAWVQQQGEHTEHLM